MKFLKKYRKMITLITLGIIFGLGTTVAIAYPLVNGEIYLPLV